MKWKKDEAQNRKIETLVSEVRSAARESTEALWNAFLEIGDLDMVRAMEKALRLLVSHEDVGGHIRPCGDRPVRGFHRLSTALCPGTDVHGGISGKECGLYLRHRHE